MAKVCRDCGIEKPLEDFKNRPGAKDGRRNDCRKCTWVREERRRERPEVKAKNNAAQRARRKRDYNPAVMRERQILRKYGITQADYESVYTAQAGSCAICGQPQAVLAIDHDHATGRVRQLLCASCNKGLGFFRDSPDLLVAAAAYLMEHAAWQSSTAGTAALLTQRQ